MGFVPIKALVALQLSLFLMGSFAFAGVVGVETLSWAHPPAHPPAHTPAYPPRHGPHYGPSPAPHHSPNHGPHLPPLRSHVAVQGVVYCKSCKYLDVDTLFGASPLSGAVVKLQCNDTKYPITEEAKTDEHGYFFILAPRELTTYEVHKCKVFLVSAPLESSCKKPTNLHDGTSGAILREENHSGPFSFDLFTVGPFAFSPTECPR